MPIAVNPPAVRHFILATAGHVDHGKSALVRALTGTDPDRLPEEKKRGITIDLGFAQLDLVAPNDPAQVFRVGVVDVPGHEDFVKNMVSGVGAADVALLVVGADDGWMPQTEEHLRILSYLGVNRAVVALTKIDLAPDTATRDAAIAAVRARLTGTDFADAPIVPTSIPQQGGLDKLRHAISQILADAPLPADFGKPRLPIDRVFTLRGIGTVVTGTLTGGTLGRGQTVVIQPSGKTARVRGIQSHRRHVECATPGSRMALNLPDVPSDPETPGAPKRGDVVTLAGWGNSSATLDAWLVRSGARPLHPGAPPEPPLQNGSAAQVHLGSGRHAARVHLLNGSAALLNAGENGLAQLRFEVPVFAFSGDRFVVRDDAGRHTLAGGIVLDPDAARRGLRRPLRRVFLERRAQAPRDVAVFLETLLVRDGCLPRVGLLAKSCFSAAEIDAALEQLAASGRIFLSEALAADGVWWEAMRSRAMEAIDAQHRAHPELSGLPMVQLAAGLAAEIRGGRRAAVFETLVQDLTTRGFATAAGNIRRTTHRPALPERLQKAGERVRAALLDKPLEPPSRATLAPDAATQAALRFLLEMGEAVELGAEIVLLAGSFARMRAGVLRRLRECGPLTASELRQALGTTRRILVPLLERLDRDGLTRREGDCRVLRETPKAT